MVKASVLIALLIGLSACSEFPHRDRIVVLQPLGTFSEVDAVRVRDELRATFKSVVLRESIPIPANAYYPARSRYRADSLLRYLKRQGSADTVVVGLLNKDISVTKGSHADWGVMGLGYRPGNACVASSFRVRKANRSQQFYKVVVHELGHTQGLPHCPERSCFMRDAEGGNPLDEERRFCASCTRFLKSKGWLLN